MSKQSSRTRMNLRRYRDGAWDTYLVYCNPYRIVFDILKEEYGDAVLQLGTPGTTSPRLLIPLL